MGNNRTEKNLIKAYIAAEALILTVIKITQQMHVGRIINCCMYSAIVVNTLVCTYFFAKYSRTIRDRRDNLIAYALFVTLIADWFLTFIGRRYSAEAYTCGLFFFCAVEAVYMLYLRPGRASVAARILLFAAGAFALYRTGQLTADNALGLLNMVLILVNVIDVWTSRKNDVSALFRAGMTLFLCCDTCIMLKSMTSGAVREAAHFMIWIFYVPAQVLLVLAYISACSKRE